MKIQILKQTGSEINFLVEGITPAFANALRRIMISEVPTMAIEWVDFRKNDSALPDEVLANRLGQVPLTFDPRIYNLPQECDCKGKGCRRCQVKLILKKKGPCMVYSGDLKSRDRDVMPVYDNIPIVELFENQELEFEATAQLGLGKEHAKWQAAVVGYKNLPKITINYSKCKGEDCKKCVEKCVKKILNVEKEKVLVSNAIECNMCMQCVEVCPEGAIEVVPVEGTYIFSVESVSGLKPEEIVVKAAEILEEKMKELIKKIK